MAMSTAARPMPAPSSGRGPAWLLPALLAVPFLGLNACRQEEKAAVSTVNPLAAQLAGARCGLAEAALGNNRRNEALLLLVSALEADPSCGAATDGLRTLLSQTRWHYPSARMELGMPVERITASGDALWVSLSSGKGKDTFNTTVRCNPDTLAVEAVLFPRPSEETRALIVSPDRSRLILQRGNPGAFLTLLFDARTLKPVTALAAFPEEPAAGSVTAFAANSLLFAHPEAGDGSVTWHIRDAATGGILRSATHPAAPRPVSAAFSGENLAVVHADGSILEIPISPVKEPSIRQGPIPAAGTAPVAAGGGALTLPYEHQAMIHGAEPITAAAHDPARAITGDAAGTLEIQTLLPAAKTTGRGMEPVRFNPEHLPALRALAEALAGLRYDIAGRKFIPLREQDRRKSIASCPPRHLAVMLAGLDLSGIRDAVLGQPIRTGGPDAAFLLRDRLTRADEDRPLYLALASASPAEPSPQDRIRKAFAEGSPEEVTAAIRALPARSPAIATALSLALESPHPEWIHVCLEAAKGAAPPFLNHLSQSRIAWLEDRKADALAWWQDGFPEISAVRGREDWDGWESADFTPAATAIFSTLRQELAAYQLPGDSTAEQRQALAARLLDGSASRAIGRERHATACLAAAEMAAEFPGEYDNVSKLAVMARALGADPAACTRAEAHSLSNRGDYGEAHQLWISLISDFPVEGQESRDYAEAAYTAFENGDATQAMSILGTGITRFPGDVDFAYRAGWISLLTGHYREAYEFLMAGDRLGYPDSRMEKATAMLAIAAAASGDRENALVYHDDLLALDGEWAAPDPPKAAEWPEELRSTLRNITEPPKALPVQE